MRTGRCLAVLSLLYLGGCVYIDTAGSNQPPDIYYAPYPPPAPGNPASVPPDAGSILTPVPLWQLR
jgi:hypothetical protein